MTTKEVCEAELKTRIARVEAAVRVAKSCLAEGDYLQCATRLQSAAEEGGFSELVMNIFDSVSTGDA